ncbi:unnamed protein product [Staurois parvus]|uniref:3-hydroxyanthranilate 3,4-dioxygenase n=1 Tax=Staurois parvus TaxID=386267 RepID=A0ABN9DTJ3_9NEOB|nr:unnamed protein product [Staurois parvus]
MCLKIIENGEHRDIHIKEGEMFLLPARIPHSPQRFPNTVGLVFERRRLKTETDGLRYYVGDSTEVLFERWFYCEDLGKQLIPVINEFFNSKQYKTGNPDPEWTPQLPFALSTVKVMEPFSFQSWLDKHRSEIIQKKYFRLFAGGHETEVWYLTGMWNILFISGTCVTPSIYVSLYFTYILYIHIIPNPQGVYNLRSLTHIHTY